MASVFVLLLEESIPPRFQLSFSPRREFQINDRSWRGREREREKERERKRERETECFTKRAKQARVFSVWRFELSLFLSPSNIMHVVLSFSLSRAIEQKPLIPWLMREEEEGSNVAANFNFRNSLKHHSDKHLLNPVFLRSIFSPIKEREKHWLRNKLARSAHISVGTIQYVLPFFVPQGKWSVIMRGIRGIHDH